MSSLPKLTRAGLQALREMMSGYPEDQIARRVSELEATPPWWHGGEYAPGSLVDRPLYLAPTREFAESYAEDGRFESPAVVPLRPNVRETASPKMLEQLARRYNPDNERLGYTPASVFDQDLHDPDAVWKLIAALRAQGFDSALGRDIPMGGGPEADVMISLPGTRAYQRGGAVSPSCACHGGKR